MAAPDNPATNGTELMVHHDVRDASQQMGVLNPKYDQWKSRQHTEDQAHYCEENRLPHRRKVNLLPGMPDQERPFAPRHRTGAHQHDCQKIQFFQHPPQQPDGGLAQGLDALPSAGGRGCGHDSHPLAAPGYQT
jgi:hypothetical protein